MIDKNDEGYKEKKKKLMWELADIEYEGRLESINSREKKEILIDGLTGYVEMDDEALINYAKEYSIEDHDLLWEYLADFEAYIVIHEILSDN